jgi:hypothetical protein
MGTPLGCPVCPAVLIPFIVRHDRIEEMANYSGIPKEETLKSLVHEDYFSRPLE